MMKEELSIAKRKVLDVLKRQGSTTASKLARQLGLTDVAIRQHLLSLESSGLVCQQKLPAEGRGRPSMQWSLTPMASDLFPDRHGELTVGLLGAMHRALGSEGVDRVIQARAEEQIEKYRAILPANGSLKSRVEALARQRTEEGYMAEVVTERPGCYLLVENHCPICEAATSCLRLCTAELEVFQGTLGGDVKVERTAHLLSGDERCAYRIQNA